MFNFPPMTLAPMFSGSGIGAFSLPFADTAILGLVVVLIVSVLGIVHESLRSDAAAVGSGDQVDAAIPARFEYQHREAA
jgi:hypothetical protein